MAKKSRNPDDYDSPWKSELQVFLQPFLEFYFPDITADIDWPCGYDALDKELQKIARRAKIGKRLADKLFKVWLKDGGERWLLIHVEVQTDYDQAFAERMFHYNVAAYQMYNKDVVGVAALCDDRPDWRPTSFHYGMWGCKTEVVFRIAKLIDYADQGAELEAGANIFGPITLATCKAIETRNDPAARGRWKLHLVKWFHKLKLPREHLRMLFDVLDYMMTLPEEFERIFEAEVAKIEEEEQMRYVNSIERAILKREREAGLEEGIEKGREEGIEKGIEKGLLEGIAGILEAKFGDPGLELLPKVESLAGLAELRKFSQFLKKAETVSEVDQYLQ
jgi:Putative transposase, YhgA-like